MNIESPQLKMAAIDRLRILRQERLSWKIPQLLHERVTVDWTHSPEARYYGNLWVTRVRDPTTEQLSWLNKIRCLSFEGSAHNSSLAVHSWTLSFDFPFVKFEVDLERNILLLLECLETTYLVSTVTLRYEARVKQLLEGYLSTAGSDKCHY